MTEVSKDAQVALHVAEAAEVQLCQLRLISQAAEVAWGRLRLRGAI